MEEDRKEMFKNYVKKLVALAKKETMDKGNLFDLACFTTATESARAAELFGRANSKLRERELLRQVCANNETGGIVFVAWKPIGEAGRQSGELKYRFLSNDRQIYDLASETLSILGGCGNVLFWTKTGGLYYECGEGDGGAALSCLIRIGFDNNFSKQIAKSCVMGTEGESCLEACANAFDCKAGEFCNFETRKCTKSCKVPADCGRVTEGCVPMGPVMGCEE